MTVDAYALIRTLEPLSKTVTIFFLTVGFLTRTPSVHLVIVNGLNTRHTVLMILT
jgi:hypothetical protein